MRDRLKKFRKDDYVEKRFGKDINVSAKEDAPLKKDMTAAETKAVSKAQPKSGASPLSFSAAFAAARKDGDKTFTWKGKSYTTQLASEKKAAPAPVRRAAPAVTARASTPASAPKKAEAPSLKAAFERAGPKAAPITSTGKTPRLLDRSTKGTTRPLFGEDGIIAGTRSPATRTAKLEEIRKAAEAPGANKLAKDRYRMAKETGMYAKGGSAKGYAKGGKIDGCAVRGKTKAGRK